MEDPSDRPIFDPGNTFKKLLKLYDIFVGLKNFKLEMNILKQGGQRTARGQNMPVKSFSSAFCSFLYLLITDKTYSITFHFIGIQYKHNYN